MNQRQMQQAVHSPTVPARMKPLLRQRLKMANYENIGEHDHSAPLTRGTKLGSPGKRRQGQQPGESPTTIAKAQNRPQGFSGGKTMTGRQAERQIPQPPEPFRNPNAALSPVPNGPTAAGSGYQDTQRPEGMRKSKAPKHPNRKPIGDKPYSTMKSQAGNPTFYGH